MEIDHNADFVSFRNSSVSSWEDEREAQIPKGEHTESTVLYDDSSTDLEYWFGNICFRYLLAQDVFARVTPGCTFLTADVCYFDFISTHLIIC